MKWRKGKIDKLIQGKDGFVRSVELLIYQSKNDKVSTIKRPVQLIIPFELCDSVDNEPAESLTNIIDRPKRLAAQNADAMRRAIEQ